METDGPPEETNPAEVLFAQFLYTGEWICQTQCIIVLPLDFKLNCAGYWEE